MLPPVGRLRLFGALEHSVARQPIVVTIRAARDHRIGPGELTPFRVSIRAAVQAAT
ncbi:hypothetical protein SAMN04487954_102337, partial [Billgrantia gudaonensis]